MADPITIGMMVVSSATAVAGGIAENNAQKHNAKIADANARNASDQAAREEGKIMRERSELVGTQIATVGGSGLTLEGSPTKVIVESAVNAEMAALNARYKGQVESTGYLNQARAFKLAGKQALTMGIIKGVSPLIGKGLGEAFKPGLGTADTGGATNSAQLTQTAKAAAFSPGKPVGFYVRS